MNYSIWAWRR